MKKTKHGILVSCAVLLLAALFSSTLSGCSTDSDDPVADIPTYEPEPKSITVTIRGHSSLAVAGVTVKVSNHESGYSYPIGSAETYDATRTVAANGTLTLPAFTVNRSKSSGAYQFTVYVDVPGKTVTGEGQINGEKTLPATLTLRVTGDASSSILSLEKEDTKRR